MQENQIKVLRLQLTANSKPKANAGKSHIKNQDYKINRLKEKLEHLKEVLLKIT